MRLAGPINGHIQNSEKSFVKISTAHMVSGWLKRYTKPTFYLPVHSAKVKSYTQCNRDMHSLTLHYNHCRFDFMCKLPENTFLGKAGWFDIKESFFEMVPLILGRLKDWEIKTGLIAAIR